LSHNLGYEKIAGKWTLIPEGKLSIEKMCEPLNTDSEILDVLRRELSQEEFLAKGLFYLQNIKNHKLAKAQLQSQTEEAHLYEDMHQLTHHIDSLYGNTYRKNGWHRRECWDAQ